MKTIGKGTGKLPDTTLEMEKENTTDTKPKYIILSGLRSDTIQKQVNLKMKEGYVLYGDIIAYVPDEEDGALYHQAMILRNEEQSGNQKKTIDDLIERILVLHRYVNVVKDIELDEELVSLNDVITEIERIDKGEKMRVYIERIPEHYDGGDLTVTIKAKKSYPYTLVIESMISEIIDRIENGESQSEIIHNPRKKTIKDLIELVREIVECNYDLTLEESGYYKKLKSILDSREE